jgi:uncharacterized repeat protein (TIGR02543 family)
MNTGLRRILPFLMLVFALMMFTACQKNKTYTITFDTLTNISIEAIEARPGQAIFTPNTPVREGYRFDGWLNQDTPFSFGVMPDRNIVLTAKWSKYYQIDFDSMGGSEIEPILIAEGDPISLSQTPKKSSHKFLAWAYQGNTFNMDTMPSSDIVLTAIWTPAVTITFVVEVYDRYLEDYVWIEIEEFVEVAGEQIFAPEPPSYPEYKFLGWTLDEVDFTFDVMPSNDITIVAKWTQLSNLPTLFIDLHHLNGSTIPIEQVNREDYVASTISLINTLDTFELLEVSAEFRGRGNGSWVDSGDKRGYRIKFESRQSILGNPSSRHWVILANANFDDITMYRNKFAFDIANELFSEIDYVTSAEWVDVYFNGNYHGVYLICEHLRVDTNRVNIESEFGVIDTGYLIEYDSYARGTEGVDYFRVQGVRYPFSMRSPKPDDYLDEGITIDQYKEQVAYIKAMVGNMVSAILSKDFEEFSNYADVNSFVDIYILHELFKNIDTGFSSFFLYRNPGGKIHAGPPWDFDATWGSSPSRGNGSPMGIFVGLSVQAFSSRTANELLISLYATPAFKQVVVERWQVLSPNILTYVNQTLNDEMIETYRFAMGRNFVRWPSPQGYGAPISQENAEINWRNNILIAKKWLIDRISWLNNEWK